MKIHSQTIFVSNHRVGWSVVLAVCWIAGATWVRAESRTWTGAGADDFASTINNWVGGLAPEHGDAVIFDGTSSADCVWDLDIEIADWTQTADYAGTITILTRYPEAGGFTNLRVTGNVTLEDGVWTHQTNTGGDTEVDRLAVSVGGDFHLGSNAIIDLRARGFAAESGPGAGMTVRRAGRAASHGGVGERTSTTLPAATYGSIVFPRHLGSGAHSTGRGGGALALNITGNATIEGTIRADGAADSSDNSYNGGAGGSVWMRAATFTGEGSIHANGGSGYYSGGGGRIALVSTQSETEPVDLDLQAYPGTTQRLGGGRAGTIYLEVGNMGGMVSQRLVIDQNQIGTNSEIFTDIPAALDEIESALAFGGELEDVTLVATNGAFVGLTTDLRMNDISWLDSRMALRSHTLYLKADTPPGDFPDDYGNGTVVPEGICFTFDNGDTLIRDGRLLWNDPPVSWRVAGVVYEDVGGTTSIDGAVNEGFYAAESMLDIEATEDTGFEFMVWDGSLPAGVAATDNPFTVDSLESNRVFRAWFRDESLDLSTNQWVATPSSDDWFDPFNWSLYMVPVAGQTVIVPDGATVILTNTTQTLTAFSLDEGAILTVEGWDSALEATEMTIAGTILHAAQSATEPDPETGEWVPDHRILLNGQNITLTATGHLDANARGYLGGYGPGAGVTSRGGGGYGGAGSAATRDGHIRGPAYGEADEPWQPGSGGGTSGEGVGGAGGGAVHIHATGTVTVDGQITVNGQNGFGTSRPGGSGGGVWITCRTFHGAETSEIRAHGGNGTTNAGDGGGGRIAIHYDPAAQAALAKSVPDVMFSIRPGTRSINLYPQEMGTLYLPDTLFLSVPLDAQRFWHTHLVIGDLTQWTAEELLLDHCVVRFPEGFELDVTADLILQNGARLGLHASPTNALSGEFGARMDVGGDIKLENDSWLDVFAHPTNGAVVGLYSAGDVTIDADSGIDAVGRGFWHFYGKGRGTSGYAAGSYGGLGGRSPGPTYGCPVFAVDPGSCGGTRIRGSGPVSGVGGGAIRLMVGGNLHIDGTLTANGTRGNPHGGGGGSGGSIFIACRRMTGTGTLRANGGTDQNDAGTGGGGRIAVWHHLPLDFVFERLESRDTSGLTHQDSLSSFGGIIQAESPQSGANPGEHGTVGFYTQLGTLIMLR